VRSKSLFGSGLAGLGTFAPRGPGRADSEGRLISGLALRRCRGDDRADFGQPFGEPSREVAAV
jgi:hypothetical protein